jgi:hypothetical protein
MAKKRKKKIADRLAKKRGIRAAESRLKRKKPPRRSKKAPPMTDDEKQATEVALMRSPLLLSLPQLDRIHLNSERLTEYLQDVKERPVENTQEFLRRGLRRVADGELLANVRLGLSHYIEAHGEEDPSSFLSASLVLTLMEKMDDLAHIPFFAALFVREVKNHPMADEPVIWKLISPLLPSRIVKPEEDVEAVEEDAPFERSKEFPHIVVPREHIGEKDR